MGKIYVGDVGTTIRVSTSYDLTNVTLAQLRFRKPDGSDMVKVATVKSPATEGILEYTTVADDLDDAGHWLVQPRIVESDGSIHLGSTARFTVNEQYDLESVEAS